MGEERGSIGFFTTYRPLIPLDIFSLPLFSHSSDGEDHLTDGDPKNNYNARVIPQAALKTILKHPKVGAYVGANDDKEVDREVHSGRASGLVFVSERKNGLETLHFAIRYGDDEEKKKPPKVMSFSDIYGAFDGVRMEDHACFAGGEYMVYVTTKDAAPKRRQPWTAVYKTHLKTGETQRLTPFGEADLSPAVSPNGKKIAVASYEGIEGGWQGQIEDLETNIWVMDLDNPSNRKLVEKKGGWPTWGGDSFLYFHRKNDHFGVFRKDLRDLESKPQRVTPEGIDAMTPAAIDERAVVVVTIRQSSKLDEQHLVPDQYRHVEIFRFPDQTHPQKITFKATPNVHHYNPFVILDPNGTPKRIGYHRTIRPQNANDTPPDFDKLQSPDPEIGLFRVSGALPTFSKDGKRLAFVDNNFRQVWIVDDDNPPRIVYEAKEENRVFCPVWNQNPEKAILYVCDGPGFSFDKTVNICAIDCSTKEYKSKMLTSGFNNAFPSTNQQGTRLVYRSTRDGGKENHKNLYIIDAEEGESGKGGITRLTEGEWNDTHCSWAPRGEWIAFSSTRDKPKDAPPTDHGLDPGYYAIYIVKANDPTVVVRVFGSGEYLGKDYLIGHVNHPFFCPDMKSLVVVGDLAGVSCDPTSLPHFNHSVRPYGEIFVIDIDPVDITKNKDVERFKRITHSRYENSTASWTSYSTEDHKAKWNDHIRPTIIPSYFICPFCIPKRLK